MRLGESTARILRRVVDVRRDELARVLPLAGAHGLVLATLYVLKPARNALFLERQGVGRLPWVLVLVAIAGGLTAALYARVARGERMERLVLQTFLVLAAILLGFRGLLQLDAAWVAYAFYVWVALFGLVATSLVWLFASSAFNTREARRVFGVIGTGGIAGAILGGAITPPLVGWLGTKDLLVVCALLVASCALLLRMVPRMEREEKLKKRGAVAPSSSGIAGSPLLKRLSLMTLLISVVAVIVEIQFNDIVDHSFATRDEKTAFFGTFFAWLSAFAFVFQLVATTRILRVFGVGPALLFLPASLALGSISLLLWPGLVAAVLLKVGDGGFRHSIHKSATEVLFLPVPAELKNRAKIFLDTTIDTAGTGIGALAVLGLGALGVAYSELSYVSIVLILGAIAVGISMRGAYVDAFRSALERREIDLGAVTTAIRDASSLHAVLPALESNNERQLIYALEMLSIARGASREVAPRVEKLLDHSSADVRRRAIAVLTASGASSMAARVEPLMRDPSLRVRVEAIHFLCSFGGGGSRSERLELLLRDADPALSIGALGCIAEYGTASDRRLIDRALVERFLREDETARAELAALLGELDDVSLRDQLFVLAKDPSPVVVENTIHSIGRTRDRRFLSFLIEKLGVSRYRAGARASIAAFGPEVIDELNRAIAEAPAPISHNIPRVIGEISAQQSIEALLVHLDDRDPRVGDEALKALNRLRVRAAPLMLRFPREVIVAAVHARIAVLHRLLAVANELDDSIHPLVARAVEEKRRTVFEQVFRLLGLSFPPRDMYNAYEGLMSARKSLRASAVEFLDNLLDAETKRVLLPLCEEPPVAAVKLESAWEALKYLRDLNDPWLRACAQKGKESHRESSPMLGVIEKVMLLQNVDVFSEVSTEQLGHLAAIAEELGKNGGEIVYKEDDAPDAMYIVLEGRVRLHRADTEVTIAGAGEAFGTWALFDDEPRVVAATTLEPVRLLRIDKEDFIDLLADNIRITQGVLKAIVRRLRRIVR